MKVAFLLSLLLTPGLEIVGARRLQKLQRSKQRLGLESTKELSSDSTGEDAKDMANAMEALADFTEEEASVNVPVSLVQEGEEKKETVGGQAARSMQKQSDTEAKASSELEIDTPFNVVSEFPDHVYNYNRTWKPDGGSHAPVGAVAIDKAALRAVQPEPKYDPPGFGDLPDHLYNYRRTWELRGGTHAAPAPSLNFVRYDRYTLNGKTLDKGWMTVKEAQQKAKSIDGCVGFTFNNRLFNAAGHHEIVFKGKDCKSSPHQDWSFYKLKES